MSEPRPLDHPSPDRPFRLYLALTDHCNRACPWCSTCSGPHGATYLDPEPAVWRRHVPADADYELQLEGGEPTVHPRFREFVAAARGDARCRRLVVCTNGVSLPRRADRLAAWVEALGEPLTLKLSINHHLLAADPGLLELAVALRDLCAPAGDARLLVLNVRRRRGPPDDDAWVRHAVEARGLLPWTNDFFLQRYGFAADRPEWADWGTPFAVSDRFALVNPDGTAHGTDLVARSEAMRSLVRMR